MRVIDPAGRGPGPRAGSWARSAPHVPEQWTRRSQFQLESLLMAGAFWAEVAEVSGEDPGYARLGRVQPLPAGDAAALAAGGGSGRRAPPGCGGGPRSGR